VSPRIKTVDTILTCPDRNYLIVKIRTADDLIGYGDATLNGRELTVKTAVDEYLAPLLIGHDAGRIEDIWQMIFRHTYWRGGPVLQTALAGVDMALWDLLGKRSGLPLSQLLGGKTRERIKTYYHVHGNTAEALVERARAAVKAGARVLRYSFSTKDPFDPESERCYAQPHQDIELEDRFEVGAGDPETANGQQQRGRHGEAAPRWETEPYLQELPRITAELRKAVGPHIGLIHDVHSRCTPVQAARAATELEPYHLLFLEDPVEPLNRAALAQVRAASTTPLATGELFNTMDQLLPLLERRLIDYIRLDISHFGGITPLRKAAYIAGAYGVQTAFHGPGDISPLAHAAQFHLDLHVPNFGIQETLRFDPRLSEVFVWQTVSEDGYVRIEDRPGLGVEVDEERAKSFPYKKAFIPGHRDQSGAVHDW